MCELKNTVRPLIAQLQNQVADLAASERIETRHRLVEEDDLGIVDERLRDADALHHALRELAQLQPPLGADADAVERSGATRFLRSAASYPNSCAKYSSSSSAVR